MLGSYDNWNKSVSRITLLEPLGKFFQLVKTSQKIVNLIFFKVNWQIHS